MHITKLDKNIVAVIDKLTDIRRSILWGLAQSNGLTPLQIQIVQYIDRCNKYTSITALDIAREFFITKATVSVAIQALIKKGIVRKHADANDRRKQHLMLTKKGKLLVQKISAQVPTFAQHLEHLDQNDKKIAYRVLLHFVQLLQQHGVIDYVRMCMRCQNCVQESNGIFKCMLTGRSFEYEGIQIDCCRFASKQAV